MIESTPFHLPVLLPQVLSYLNVAPGKKYIDATIGGGGYTEAILRLGGIVLGIDRDQDAISYVRSKYQISQPKADQPLAEKFKVNKELFIAKGNFADIEDIAKKLGFVSVEGVVFDLGLSSYQIEKSGRGFSYKRDEPLDMRADGDGAKSAYDVVNSYGKEELYEIFSKYAEEFHSGAIASAIIRARTIEGKIRTTSQLAYIIANAVRGKRDLPAGRQDENKSVARIFQAIRIEVNEEIKNLKAGLFGAVKAVAPGGKIAVVSYHSLEDRVVKVFFDTYARKQFLKETTRRPIVADQIEQQHNPRARSAKLRVATKL